MGGWSRRACRNRCRTPVTQWIDAIAGDGPVDYGLTEGIQLTELMEGAYRAHRQGRTVSYPLD